MEGSSYFVLFGDFVAQAAYAIGDHLYKFGYFMYDTKGFCKYYAEELAQQAAQNRAQSVAAKQLETKSFFYFLDFLNEYFRMSDSRIKDVSLSPELRDIIKDTIKQVMVETNSIKNIYDAEPVYEELRLKRVDELDYIKDNIYPHMKILSKNIFSEELKSKCNLFLDIEYNEPLKCLPLDDVAELHV